jgi:hypothetical protein
MLGDNEVYQNNVQQAQQREYIGWRFDDDGDDWTRQPEQQVQRPERIHWDALINSRLEHTRRLFNSSRVNWTHLTLNPNVIRIFEQPIQQPAQPVQQEEQPEQQEEQPEQQEEQQEQQEEPSRRYIDRYIGVRLNLIQ